MLTLFAVHLNYYIASIKRKLYSAKSTLYAESGRHQKSHPCDGFFVLIR